MRSGKREDRATVSGRMSNKNGANDRQKKDNRKKVAHKKLYVTVTVKSNNTQTSNFLFYTNTYLAFVGL